MNDIYQITSRMKNFIAREGIALSPAGKILLNTYALAVKDLYDFADTLADDPKQRLRDLLASKENVPAYIIKLTSPQSQATIDEEVSKKEVEFDSLEKALDQYEKEYNALGEEYGVSGDELWLRAENASMLDEDCIKIMRLNRRIQMCKYLINKNKANRCEHDVNGYDCFICYPGEMIAGPDGFDLP